MRILCSITLLVTALTQQGPLIRPHNATNGFGLTTANVNTAGASLQTRRPLRLFQGEPALSLGGEHDRGCQGQAHSMGHRWDASKLHHHGHQIV